MSGHYNKLGVEFLFPENWRIEDEETSSWPRTVSVYSPSGGFWSLIVYNEGEPTQLVADAKATIEKEYHDVESAELTASFGEFDLIGSQLYFYCLDFLVNVRVQAVEAAGQTYLLMWQAEDNEFLHLEPVFRAISTSLFRNVSESLAARSNLAGQEQDR